MKKTGYLENNLNSLTEITSLLESPEISMDFITSICGTLRGQGCYRKVFDYNLDDRFVVKVELKNTNCNTIEHMMWEEIEGLTGELEWVREWFAPVIWISPGGRLLVMEKTKDYHKTRKPPEKIPSFLWDTHSANFGWIKNRFVCHDYGQFYNFISYNKVFKKVKW
jgi:hypothetical protein